LETQEVKGSGKSWKIVRPKKRIQKKGDGDWQGGGKVEKAFQRLTGA